MKVMMIMFDSLNRQFLPPYGCEWVHAPNFKRLAEKTVVFDNCYAGSLPCMPARRELHAGRYNFLHRSWGPLEPFDDSIPEILKKSGIYTHLISDHYHYWEDGGCTYHSRYNSWEISRGQEGDPWKGLVKDPEIPEHVYTNRIYKALWRQDWVNRTFLQKEKNLPQAKTFKKGLEFIKMNHDEDNWFLHVETFDPHEPFYTLQKYKDLYKHEYKGPHFDWPNYSIVMETPEQVKHCRLEYAALVSMCDAYLGKVLDLMDQYDMWRDTMLIVNTDHGFFLGEKDWWAKIVQPLYDEVVHTPLFIWDPRSEKRNERRNALVQTIDLAPTILEFFDLEIPKSMQGIPLRETIASDSKVRKVGLFGVHGGHVNITDGRYVYMRAPTNPRNEPLYNYTLMPTHMDHIFTLEELHTIELAEKFSFTKGCKTMKIKYIVDVPETSTNSYVYGSLLFDLQNDPKQENSINDTEIEKRMIKLLVELMKENDAPIEQYKRLGLPLDGNVKEEHLNLIEKREGTKDKIGNTEIIWMNKGKSMYSLLINKVPEYIQRQFILGFEQEINSKNSKEVDENIVVDIFKKYLPVDIKSNLKSYKKLIREKAK